MPLYEYRCDACEHEFEELIRAESEEPESCPSCGQKSVERLISNTSFQLKGSGWYETDYARDDGPHDDTAPDTEQEISEDGSGARDSDEAAESSASDASNSAAETVPAGS